MIDQPDDVGPPMDETDFSASNAAGEAGALDDDELLLLASRQLEAWSAGELPGLTEVQKLFHKLLLHDASSMARDKLIAAIIKKFGKEFGGSKALSSTWTQIAKQVAAERTEAARERHETLRRRRAEASAA